MTGGVQLLSAPEIRFLNCKCKKHIHFFKLKVILQII